MLRYHVVCYQNAQRDRIVVPVAYDKAGFGRLVNRAETLNPHGTSAELGALVRTATKLCDISLFDPTNGNPHLAAAGVKSRGQLMKKWHLVTIRFGDDAIQITPSTRSPKGAYQDLFRDGSVLPTDASDVALGDAIEAAFQQCRDGAREPDYGQA